MADREYSEIDLEIRSLVSQLRELHEKVEERILKLMKVVEEGSRTNDERETGRVLVEMLIKDRDEARKLLEDHGVFVDSRNKNDSLVMKTSKMGLLKECVQKLKTLDLGIQERRIGERFSDQEKGEGGSSSGYVADVETGPNDPVFSIDDSDTSSEAETEVWNEKNVDPDAKRRFLGKAITGSSSETDMEDEIDNEEFIGTSDDKGFSTNIEGLRELRDLFIGETSGEKIKEDVKKDSGNDADREQSPEDGNTSSNIEGLAEDLKKEDEAKSGSH